MSKSVIALVFLIGFSLRSSSALPNIESDDVTSCVLGSSSACTSLSPAPEEAVAFLQVHSMQFHRSALVKPPGRGETVASLEELDSRLSSSYNASYATAANSTKHSQFPGAADVVASSLMAGRANNLYALLTSVEVFIFLALTVAGTAKMAGVVAHRDRPTKANFLPQPTAHKAPATANQNGKQCVEMKVGGMTCSACSGTLERYLQGQDGVISATVNLILEKATVIYEGSATNATEICEACDDVGFDAKILSQGLLDQFANSGKADLHVNIPFAADCAELQEFANLIGEMHGALGWSFVRPGVARVSYQPAVIGARKILGSITTAFPKHAVTCATPQENDQTANLKEHAAELWSNFRWCAVPALLVFIITIILPSANIELGSVYCRSMLLPLGGVHLHVATLIVLFLATPVQFVFGADFHKQAKKALSRGAPNMDVLVSVATTISFSYAMILLVATATGSVDPAISGSMHKMSGMKGHMDMMAQREPGVVFELGCHALHFFGMSPILMTVVLLGKTIETGAKIKTMESLTKLMECKVVTAQLVTERGEEAIELELVEVGDSLRLFDGSRVPVDGLLSSDTILWVNEAILTGESRPVQKTKGSALMGGTMVISGSGLMKASVVGSQTALGEIVTLVSNAQATKTKAQRMAGVIASYFVGSVMICSIVVFGVWFFLVETGRVIPPREGKGDLNMFDAILFAAKFGTSVLMIACPCAMGLATPTAVMVSTSVAAEHGCMVKSAEALEETAKLGYIVLDKTGTITTGTPHISKMALTPFASEVLTSCCEAAALQLSRDQLPVTDLVHGDTNQSFESVVWWLLGVAESGSDHPLAKCLVQAAESALACKGFPQPESFRYRVGRGVSAAINQGTRSLEARVGNMAFLNECIEERKQDMSQHAGLVALSKWSSDMETIGCTVVIMHAVIDKKIEVLGAWALRDEIRSSAKGTIKYLQENLGTEVWMLTGDCAKAAKAIAAEVGIDPERVVAEALPKQKAEKIAELKAKAGDRRVCMVGDGVNDAPALAAADVGIAIGAGMHVAVEAADIVLVRSELEALPALLKLCKETAATIRLNFVWAFLFNFCGLPLAAGVFYPRVSLPPLVAGIAMAMSSVTVVSCSLSLRRFQAPRIDGCAQR